ncbi:iron-containing alcohol dehydrogenase [Rhodovulum sp.]|uniref:iron-containing alcohol dehydrogenase n=1 Tax=Rhodovulum sp. TaxID=34009 RepID=UPI00180817B9|nr:iron-containing alcohol dehydrogenase [Rhodovulum sp.]HDR28820.1 iron-containing alcohol dehydrogenase [Rhodovulum sp.]
MTFAFLTPGRILFGRGAAAEAPARIAAMGRRILLVRGGSVQFADVLAEGLRAAGAAVLELRGQGEPDLSGLEAALAEARPFAPDAVAAIGGGSVLDLGKALAALVPSDRPPLDHLEVVGQGLPLCAPPLPLAALPTTAGTGSEATKNAVIGVPAHGRKVSLRDDRLIPALALVDPALTDGCPWPVTLASGLDAVTQVIEPYLSLRANPLTDALCRDAIPRGLAALVRLRQAEDPAARDALALVSLIGGIALANAGLGAVHGLAGVIGGRYAAPHGAICGRLLTPTLRENRAALAAEGQPVARFDEVAGWIAGALGCAPGDAFRQLSDWIDAAGLPRLADLCEGPLDAVALARAASGSSSMKANPAALSPEALARIVMAG